MSEYRSANDTHLCSFFQRYQSMIQLLPMTSSATPHHIPTSLLTFQQPQKPIVFIVITVESFPLVIYPKGIFWLAFICFAIIFDAQLFWNRCFFDFDWLVAFKDLNFEDFFRTGNRIQCVLIVVFAKKWKVAFCHLVEVLKHEVISGLLQKIFCIWIQLFKSRWGWNECCYITMRVDQCDKSYTCSHL